MNTESNIVASIAPEDTGENRGLTIMICPVCSKRVRDTDLERYYCESANTVIELCSDCREEFEGDHDVQIDSDTLDADTYRKLFDFASAAALKADDGLPGLNELTAPMVASALDGDAWQSGGGIWLIVKRTSDGRVVTISPEVVNEYANKEAFEKDWPKSSLQLT